MVGWMSVQKTKTSTSVAENALAVAVACQRSISCPALPGVGEVTVESTTIKHVQELKALMPPEWQLSTTEIQQFLWCKLLTFRCFFYPLTGACLTISVTTFAIMIGEDRTWMPRFDINTLSWSFGLAVVAGFLAVFSAICMAVYTLMKKYELLPRDDDDYIGASKKSLNMMPMVPKI